MSHLGAEAHNAHAPRRDHSLGAVEHVGRSSDPAALQLHWLSGGLLSDLLDFLAQAAGLMNRAPSSPLAARALTPVTCCTQSVSPWLRAMRLGYFTADLVLLSQCEPQVSVFN